MKLVQKTTTKRRLTPFGQFRLFVVSYRKTVNAICDVLESDVVTTLIMTASKYGMNVVQETAEAEGLMVKNNLFSEEYAAPACQCCGKDLEGETRYSGYDYGNDDNHEMVKEVSFCSEKCIKEYNKKVEAKKKPASDNDDVPLEELVRDGYEAAA